MTQQEIRDHIFLTLAKLYEDPLHRKQFKRFTFKPSDEQMAQEVITKLVENYIVEQIQPYVVRLTDLGYKIIQQDIARIQMEITNKHLIDERQNLKPPTPEEIKIITVKLKNPDYISASSFTGGQSEIYWATTGFQRVTGYTLEELKKDGGSLALFRNSNNLKKIEKMAHQLLDGQELREEIDIYTKNSQRRTIRFLAMPRYDSEGRVVGTLSAVRAIT